jgi:hypothetical protein
MSDSSLTASMATAYHEVTMITKVCHRVTESTEKNNIGRTATEYGAMRACKSVGAHARIAAGLSR